MIRLLESRLDISKVKIRLKNINNLATKNVSFVPSDISIFYQEKYLSPTLTSLEDYSLSSKLNPSNIDLFNQKNIYAFDESTQYFRALEGDLFFNSSSVIKIDKKYMYNIDVLPYFLTSMKKFSDKEHEGIVYSENVNETRNLIMIKSKIDLINTSVDENSIIFIDGPLVGGNASSYFVKMDEHLRQLNCIPLYFVKNSNSRLIIDAIPEFQNIYNNDFHWSSKILINGNRSAFFRYNDLYNKDNSKVFCYLKPLLGFPVRIEMHSKTFEKYNTIINDILDLVSYLFIVQGDFANPQVRPIAIAEKYARAGLEMLNIPVLLNRMGFHPTVNQVRFG